MMQPYRVAWNETVEDDDTNTVRLRVKQHWEWTERISSRALRVLGLVSVLSNSFSFSMDGSFSVHNSAAASQLRMHGRLCNPDENRGDRNSTSRECLVREQDTRELLVDC